MDKAIQDIKGVIQSVLGRVDARSTKIPPKTKFFSALATAAALKEVYATGTLDDFIAAFTTAYGSDPGLAVASLYLATSGPRPAAGSPRRSSALPSTGNDTDELKRLKASDDVAAIITAGPFWQGQAVSGQLWKDTRGSANNEIRIQLPGVSAPWTSGPMSFSSSDYVNAAQAVVPKQSGGKIGDVDVRLRILAAADYPQLMLAQELGMLSRARELEHTSEIIDAATSICVVAIQQLKHLVQAPRPAVLAMGVQFPTNIDPQYTAFPGGHAAVCGMQASLLASLSGAGRGVTDSLEAIARQIAEDRELAGLHSAIDTTFGLDLGKSLGRWLAQLSNDPAAPISWAARFKAATEEWV